jgi:hypothetical protein
VRKLPHNLAVIGWLADIVRLTETGVVPVFAIEIKDIGGIAAGCARTATDIDQGMKQVKTNRADHRKKGLAEFN